MRHRLRMGAGVVVRCALAVALVGALFVAFEASDGPTELLQLRYQVDRYLTTGETFLQTLLLVLGVPAALILAGALATGSELAPGLAQRVVEVWERTPSRALHLGFAALAAALTVLGAIYFTDLSWFTDDELTYLHQARIYASGALTEPAMAPRAAFPHPLVIDVPPGADGARQGHWTGVYPVFPPMLLALGHALGSAHLTQVLVVALVVYHTGRFAESFFRARAAGLVAAALTATSPALLGLGTGFHNVLPAMLFTVVAARATHASVEERDAANTHRHAMALAGAAGLAAGLVFLCRPLEGTLVVLASGLVFLGRAVVPVARRDWPLFRKRFATLAVFGVAGLVALSFYLITNQRVMGSPLTTPYQMLEDARGKFFGFGPGRLWGVTHSFPRGVSQVVTSLARLNLWLFAWPISLVALYPYLRGTIRDRRVIYLLGVGLVHVVTYLFFSFGSVHDFGSAYGSWHLTLMAVVTAGAYVHFATHRAGDPRLSPLALVVSFSIVGWSTFGVLQARRVRDVAAIIQTPIHAAEAAIPDGEAIVLWRSYQPPGAGVRSWVYHPPLPHEGDRIWWFHETGSSTAAEIAAAHPDRPLYRFGWRGTRTSVERVELNGRRR